MRAASNIRVWGLCAALSLIFFLPLIAHGQSAGTCTAQFCPLEQMPASSKLNALYSSNTTNISSYINGLFKVAIAVGAMAAVIRLAYAGYLYMGSAEMWSSKGAAKKVIGDVTFGLLLLLGVWLILDQINPDILSLNAFQNINPAPTATTATATGQ